MDAVSHLLRLAHIDASLDKRCLLGGSTGMDVVPQGERQAPFHVLLDGSCRLEVGASLLDLRPGDVVVIPSGAPHRIETAGGGRGRGTTEMSGDAFVTTRSDGGGAAVIDLFCGHYTFGAGAGSMLFRSLPDPVHVSFGRPGESDEVLRMLSALMRGEARREGEGTAAILSALCSVLLAMVLRTSRGATSCPQGRPALGQRMALPKLPKLPKPDFGSSPGYGSGYEIGVCPRRALRTTLKEGKDAG
jgi:hypothetical protein